MNNPGLAATLLGCLSIGVAFGGVSAQKTIPKEGVAILVNERNSHISIDIIDGQREGVKPYGKYELTPGRHTLRARYYYRVGNAEWSGNDFVDYSFPAESGTVLKIVCDEKKASKDKGTWRLWIADMSTGEDVNHKRPRVVESKEVQENFEREFAAMRSQAEQGDAESQYALGLWYERGDGASQNAEEAAKWYLKAASQGHASAQYMFGVCLELGQGVIQDHSEAFAWMSLAALNGDPSALAIKDEYEKDLTPADLDKSRIRLKSLITETQAKPVVP